ncbi:MAG: hypothetical protein Ct9H300mP12_14850 [Acidimicrobiales bacterium]|nr:MAG: hypothetical protein Ct9H300mP12_14850 [Acidimicrobiales bacterium]
MSDPTEDPVDDGLWDHSQDAGLSDDGDSGEDPEESHRVASASLAVRPPVHRSHIP